MSLMNKKYMGMMALIMTCHVSCDEQSEDNKAQIKQSGNSVGKREFKEVNLKIAPESVKREINGKYSILELLINIRDNSTNDYVNQWYLASGHNMLKSVLDRWVATLEYDIQKTKKLTTDDLKEQLEVDFINKSLNTTGLIEWYKNTWEEHLPLTYFPIIKEKVQSAFDSEYGRVWLGVEMGEDRVLLMSIELYRNIFKDFTVRQSVYSNIVDFATKRGNARSE